MTKVVRKSLVLAGVFGLPGMLSLTACGGSEGDVAVYDIQPRQGGPEQRIQITGANFRQDVGYTVYFAGDKSPSVTIMDTTTLLVVTPHTEEQGSVDVVVAADDGPAFRVRDGFAFAAAGAAPPSGGHGASEGAAPTKRF